MVSHNNFYLLLDKAILKESSILGKASRGFKIPLTMYSMFPASCSRGWLVNNAGVNITSLNRWIDKYIELGIIQSSTRSVKCFSRSRKVKSFMLTPYGKKYIDQFYQNIFAELKPKDQTELINSPIYSDIINL